jgi:GntR family transcriptional repressor for pyruvate dehydrogenase complex
MAKFAFKPARRATLSEDICQQLVNQIAAGELAPGSKLPPEHELMEMFSVGRSSVREALRALALLGLVETRQGYGACVAGQSESFLGKTLTWTSLANVRTNLEIVEAREVIETGVAQIVAARATPYDVELLEQLLADMEADLSDMMGFAEMDVSFHTSLAEIAGNRLLSQFIVSLRGLLHQTIIEDLKKSADLARISLDQHREIVDAIKKGNPDLAGRAMKYHLRDVSGRLLTSLGNGRTGSSG